MLTLPTTGYLGGALRSQVALDRDLIEYCETGHLDALERARGACFAALKNIERELINPSIHQRQPTGRTA